MPRETAHRPWAPTPAPLDHGMAHQAADAAIPVWERVDVVEAVMRCGDREDFSSRAQSVGRIPRGEAIHEGGDPVARRRDVSADLNVLFGAVSETSGLHLEGVMFALDQEHRFRRVLVEGRVQTSESPRTPGRVTRLRCKAGRYGLGREHGRRLRSEGFVAPHPRRDRQRGRVRYLGGV
jgi:hypothetical protein